MVIGSHKATILDCLGAIGVHWLGTGDTGDSLHWHLRVADVCPGSGVGEAQGAHAGWGADACAAAQHPGDHSVVTKEHPAHPGETITAYTTGLLPRWPLAPFAVPEP